MTDKQIGFALVIITLLIATIALMLDPGKQRARYVIGGVFLTIIAVLAFAGYRQIEPPASPKGAVLLSETFNSPDRNREYLPSDPNAVSFIGDRLRFTPLQPRTGYTVTLPGQYEDFALEFSVFPVGDLYDTSVNILVRHHGEGWYEFQIQLRTSGVAAFKATRLPGDQVDTLIVADWQTRQEISLGVNSTRVRVEAEGKVFTLWVNQRKVISFEDPAVHTNLRGSILLGVGSGETNNIPVEIDDIEIRAR